MPEKTAEEVSLLVHQLLDFAEVDDRAPDKAPVRLLVEDDSVHRAEYSWRVRVRPSREPRRWSYLYEELGLVSEKIAEMTGLNVLFTADDPVESDLAIAWQFVTLKPKLNVLGESIAVVAVRESDIESLRSDQVFAVRALAKAN